MQHVHLRVLCWRIWAALVTFTVFPLDTMQRHTRFKRVHSQELFSYLPGRSLLTLGSAVPQHPLLKSSFTKNQSVSQSKQHTLSASLSCTRWFHSADRVLSAHDFILPLPQCNATLHILEVWKSQLRDSTAASANAKQLWFVGVQCLNLLLAIK